MRAEGGHGGAGCKRRVAAGADQQQRGAQQQQARLCAPKSRRQPAPTLLPARCSAPRRAAAQTRPQSPAATGRTPQTARPWPATRRARTPPPCAGGQHGRAAGVAYAQRTHCCAVNAQRTLRQRRPFQPCACSKFSGSSHGTNARGPRRSGLNATASTACSAAAAASPAHGGVSDASAKRARQRERTRRQAALHGTVAARRRPRRAAQVQRPAGWPQQSGRRGER